MYTTPFATPKQDSKLWVLVQIKGKTKERVTQDRPCVTCVVQGRQMSNFQFSFMIDSL